MADIKYTMLMQLGPKQGETVAVLGEEFVMGRDPSCEWPIEDIEVSRRHTRLVIEDGAYSIEDLGSTNGTFVNGQRIRSLLPLLPGATIRLGENVLLFFDKANADIEDTSTKTLRVDKQAAEAELETPQVEEEAIPEDAPKAKEVASPPQVKAEAEPQPDIQEMKSPARPRRERPTTILIFGNQIGMGVIAIALIAALALIAFLWYVDANFLWCDVFGNLIPACR